jgi:glyoxylase-like metal-dependent hydrolase (beta-lactamase superfamily II)
VILKTLAVGPFAANCYILATEPAAEGVIIDPGDQANVILQNVSALGLSIKHIILTHGHIDHVGALKDTKEATGADIVIHTEDAPTLSKDLVNRMLGLTYPKPPPPDRLLDDGDIISFADISLKVLHTPGHSPGSICLLMNDHLFSGDTLFSGSIGRSDLPGGDYTKLMHSLKTRLLMLPDDIRVYPGHGPATTIGEERKQNPFLQD